MVPRLDEHVHNCDGGHTYGVYMVYTDVTMHGLETTLVTRMLYVYSKPVYRLLALSRGVIRTLSQTSVIEFFSEN